MTSAGDWTEEEQQRLEEGLVLSAATTDAREKWRAIAKHVGTRDVAACRERFNYCRKLALAAAPVSDPSPEASEDDEEVTAQAADAHEAAADPQASGRAWARPGDRWGSRGWRNWRSSWHDQQWTEGSESWNASGSGWNSSHAWNDTQSWQEATQDAEEWQQEEEQEEAMTEEQRRALELRREVEANRERLRRREEQKQNEESQRQKKRQAELEEMEKKKREYAEEQNRKYQEAQEKKRQLREQALEQERKAKREAERTDIPFFDDKRSPALPKSGGPAAAAAPTYARGWASKANAKKGQAQRQRKQEEMERKAAEVLANIAGTKAGSAAAPEESSEEEEPPAPVRREAPAQPPAQPEAKAPPSPRPAASAEATPAKATSSRVGGPKGKGKPASDSAGSNGGKGAAGGCKGADASKGAQKGASRQHKKRWWQKLDGECAISLAPLCELPQPPFGLENENSSAVHYYDARFLASFLVSSCDFIDPANRRPLTLEECIALDDHLMRYHREDPVSSVADAFALFQGRGHSETAAGDDQVQREATAVLQHLFRFGSYRRTDARGRAVNYADAGLTVVDDDDILAAAETPAEAPPADEGRAYPSLGGGAGSGSSAGPTSAAWRDRQASAYPSAAEAFPTLASSKPKGPSPKSNAAKASGAGRGQGSSGGRGRGGPQRQHQLSRTGPKGWGAPK